MIATNAVTITTSMKPTTTRANATLASTTTVTTSAIMPIVSPTVYTSTANINSVSEPSTPACYSSVVTTSSWDRGRMQYGEASHSGM